LAEIRPVTSEALQARIRALLPSQKGFGEDLQASNVILPTIDLTPAAEGTIVPEYQQQALAYGSQTEFQIGTLNVDIITTTGFYRVFGTGRLSMVASGNSTAQFILTDSINPKVIYFLSQGNSTSFNEVFVNNFDFIVFLAAGEKLQGNCANSGFLSGSFRQVADVNGNAVNPSGFSPQ